MVKFILGNLFAFFQLSVHTRSGTQRESDTKGWEKRLCLPVRRGKRVCVSAKQTVLGRRRGTTSSLNTSKLHAYFRKNKIKNLGLCSFIQPFEEAHSRWLGVSFSPPEASSCPESSGCHSISSVGDPQGGSRAPWRRSATAC